MKKFVFVSVLSLLLAASALAQTTASIKGNVIDPSGAAVVGAKITVRNVAQGFERITATTSGGDYEVPLLPPGVYVVKVEGSGFQAQQAKNVVVEASQNIVQNFSLKVAAASEVVTVESAAPIIESTTMTVGQTVDQRYVQEFPLNGRHFIDLALFTPGTLTAPQNGFLTAPLRGQGALSVVTAGMREDAVNYVVNGINLNDMVQNQITFQPAISTVGEFKVDNSTYSAEYGRNSGAIVNIATRSGSNQYHGEVYDYLRNNYFDARNAFNPVTLNGLPNRMNQFDRNQYGGDFGGAIYKDKTFFFVSYEGMRQKQGLALASQVFPDGNPATTTVAGCTAAGATITRACIAAVGNPISNAILGLIPHANTALNGSLVPNGFSGSTPAPVNIDQGAVDINHNFNDNDRLHGFYVYQSDLRLEPGSTGNASIPGFGDTRTGKRQLFTLNETHVFSSSLVNEANLGVNRILILFAPNATATAASLGLATTLGPNETALPSFNFSNIGLIFGGERNFPQGRGDLTAVLGDNISYLKGRHSFKFGGEFRDFRYNPFNNDPGQLTFTSLAHFMNGIADTATRTVGVAADRANVNAIDFYAMDSYKWKPYFTWELGVRYALNRTPTDADGRMVNFVPGGALGSMLVAAPTPFAQNSKNFQPRIGFAWDVFHNGKTLLRAGYALQVDEPVGNLVSGLWGNPPTALPISINNGAAGTAFTALPALFNGTPASISPTMVDPKYKDAQINSYNLNIQHQLARKTSMMVGYFGSKGTHLEDDININQTTVLGQTKAGNLNTALPFQILSPNSPFLPNVPLGSSIVDHTSGSNSIYNALWATVTQKAFRGMQFNVSYTFSHSIDDVSRDTGGGPGIQMQNSNNIFSNRANSDFDARQRLVANGIYALPFKGNRFTSGWEIAPIVTLQSGNPFNIVVNNSSSINGVANTVRPTVSAPLQVTGNPLGQWIANPSAFVFPQPANSFGNLGRNSVTGPSFMNADLTLAKNTKLTERVTLQLRCDVFDLLNHPNYANPGPQAGGYQAAVLTPGTPAVGATPATGNQYTTFSTILATRTPTGDFGSSRQLQLAAKFTF
jgi:hypothetical protein